MSGELKMVAKGEEFAVGISFRDEGRHAVFFVKIGENRTLSDESWNGLYRQVMEHLRKNATPINVSFARLFSGGGVQHGTVTGIHGGTGAYLVRWADGTKGQLEDRHGTFLRPLTREEAEQLELLVEAQTAARTAVDEFTRDKKIVLTREVNDALKPPPQRDPTVIEVEGAPMT